MTEQIVFLSYRRSDSQHATGRLRNRLVPRHFADGEVFMDISDIDKGTDFAQRLDSELANCKVALVVIGKTWTSVTDDSGRRRIDRPDDFVAREVAACIGRGIPVIPVLVDEANMPGSADLPPSLQALARRNAVFLVHDRFDQDADALAREIKRLIGRPEDAELDLLKLLFSFKGTASRKQFWIGMGAMLVLQFVVLLGLLWGQNLPFGTLLTGVELLPPKQQALIQIGLLPFLWPSLAIAWKRVRDIGHGWGLFLPMMGVGALQVGLALAGQIADARTTSLIFLVLLVLLGTINGTRFVAAGAPD